MNDSECTRTECEAVCPADRLPGSEAQACHQVAPPPTSPHGSPEPPRIRVAPEGPRRGDPGGQVKTRDPPAHPRTQGGAADTGCNGCSASTAARMQCCTSMSRRPWVWQYPTWTPLRPCSAKPATKFSRSARCMVPIQRDLGSTPSSAFKTPSAPSQGTWLQDEHIVNGSQQLRSQGRGDRPSGRPRLAADDRSSGSERRNRSAARRTPSQGDLERGQIDDPRGDQTECDDAE